MLKRSTAADYATVIVGTIWRVQGAAALTGEGLGAVLDWVGLVTRSFVAGMIPKVPPKSEADR